MKTIKFSSLQKEIEKGYLVLGLSIKDSSKIVKNSKGTLTFATTIFQKAYPSREKGDKIIKVGKKEVNVSELKRIIKSNNKYGAIWQIRVGKINHAGKITF